MITIQNLLLRIKFEFVQKKANSKHITQRLVFGNTKLLKSLIMTYFDLRNLKASGKTNLKLAVIIDISAQYSQTLLYAK